MATDVILTLDELRCVRERDRGGDGSEPYIWSALIWVDDDTLATDALVGSAIGTLDDAQRIIRESFRAGQTARSRTARCASGATSPRGCARSSR